MSKKEKRTVYQIMKSSLDKSFEPTEEEIKKINSFLYLKLISNDPLYIHIANTLNFFKDIDIINKYKFIRNSSINKIKFINFSKTPEEKEKAKEIEKIMKKYKCNYDVGEQYYEILKNKS